MSSRCKPKPACFRRDIHGLLLAAEAAQKADILTYSSGHLGPRSLNPSPPHREQKQPFWRTPRGSEETPNPVTPTKALKKKAVKHCPSESSTHTVSDVSRSRRAPAADRSSRADITGDKCLPNIDLCSPNSLVLRPRALHQKKSNFPSGLLGKPPSDQKGPSDKGHLKTKQRLGGKVVAKQDLRAGINVAEVHERKLQKELERLSAQSCPGRDRLAVFTDVFDDVCEGSPVFGRILREIKTEYDMYVNHLMASQPLLQNVSLETSLKGPGNDKVRQTDLEDSEKEVFRLEQEAKGALEENKRARNESKNIPATIGPEDGDTTNASLSGLRDGGLDAGHSTSVRSKRLQVLNTWRENQQLEEELEEMLVSSGTTTATQRCIKDLKMEIMRLIASNNCLNTTNKDLENNINMVLNRERASKTMRRTLWDEIHCDLQTRE
ncbi:uncharacterized protein C6orf118-like isoform X2 [Pungitius pungitius]|uniref:uncharacterized protein C6orf118-like isoform X2 n=1 Tax=Pungitius pungitius TaxID=134920 RepID=UPI00188855F3|nr:uncharacterized protein C6orf118-like isoform X2 [Pungitius pungitius]